MLAISHGAREELIDDADAAVRQLYACHGRALCWYAGRFCLDWASADDIVQETFIRAWRRGSAGTGFRRGTGAP